MQMPAGSESGRAVRVASVISPVFASGGASDPASAGVAGAGVLLPTPRLRVASMSVERNATAVR